MHFELRLDEDIDSEGVEDFMIKPRSNANTLSSVPLVLLLEAWLLIPKKTPTEVRKREESDRGIRENS